MKTNKMKVIADNKWIGGFEWYAPTERNGKYNFQIKCCDCGLVHDTKIRFKKKVLVIGFKRI